LPKIEEKILNITKGLRLTFLISEGQDVDDIVKKEEELRELLAKANKMEIE